MKKNSRFPASIAILILLAFCFASHLSAQSQGDTLADLTSEASGVKPATDGSLAALPLDKTRVPILYHWTKDAAGKASIFANGFLVNKYEAYGGRGVFTANNPGYAENLGKELIAIEIKPTARIIDVWEGDGRAFFEEWLKAEGKKISAARNAEFDGFARQFGIDVIRLTESEYVVKNAGTIKRFLSDGEVFKRAAAELRAGQATVENQRGWVKALPGLDAGTTQQKFELLRQYALSGSDFSVRLLATESLARISHFETTALQGIKSAVTNDFLVMAASGRQRSEYRAVWPRDALLVGLALRHFDRPLAANVVRRVFELPTDNGLFYQKYDLSGQPSRGAWCNANGRRQIDQDALRFVAAEAFPEVRLDKGALQRSYDALLSYVGQKQASTDVWEQKQGYFFYNTATLIRGLKAAEKVLPGSSQTHQKIMAELIGSIDSFYDTGSRTFVKGYSERIVDLDVVMGLNQLFRAGVKWDTTERMIERAQETLARVEADLCKDVKTGRGNVRLPVRYVNDPWNGETFGNPGPARPWPKGAAHISQAYSYLAEFCIDSGKLALAAEHSANAKKWLTYMKNSPHSNAFPEVIGLDGSLPAGVARPLAWSAAELLVANRLVEGVETRLAAASISAVDADAVENARAAARRQALESLRLDTRPAAVESARLGIAEGFAAAVTASSGKALQNARNFISNASRSRAVSSMKGHTLGAANFGTALFLKELMVAAETRNLDGITTLGHEMVTPRFWASYGAFVVGARASQVGFEKLLAQMAPKILHGVLRSNIALAGGLAAMQLLSGTFEPKRFAVTFGSLFVASSIVHAVKWALIGGLVFTGPVGWVILAVDLAVTLYLAEKLEVAFWKLVEKRRAKQDEASNPAPVFGGGIVEQLELVGEGIRQ